MDILEPIPAFAQLSGEDDTQYAWFSRYCEAGEQRDVRKIARQCGVPYAQLREASVQHRWSARTMEYDQTRANVASSLISNDDEEHAMAAQRAAGIMMMQLGLSALQIKNPARIPVKQAAELVARGGELVGRGTGQANVNVTIEAKSNVERMLLELTGEAAPSLEDVDDE